MIIICNLKFRIFYHFLYTDSDLFVSGSQITLGIKVNGRQRMKKQNYSCQSDRHFEIAAGCGVSHGPYGLLSCLLEVSPGHELIPQLLIFPSFQFPATFKLTLLYWSFLPTSKFLPQLKKPLANILLSRTLSN